MAVPTTWIAPSADGRLEVFVVGTRGGAGGVQLWHLYQIAPAGGWSQWVSHGSPPPEFNNWNNPVLARDSDGLLELFMGFGAQTFQIWQTSRNGGWTPQWTQHPVAPGNIGTAVGALILRSDGRLELFAEGIVSAQDSALWHITQTAPSQGWTDWASLGTPAAAGGLRLPVVAASADGRLEVFAIGSDGALWHIWQTSLGGAWSAWLSHGTPPGTAFDGLRRPVVAPNTEGRLELFAVANDKALWHIWQVAPSGGWSSWTSHGHPPSTNPPFPTGVWNTPALALNSAGRLELFVAGTNTELWHIWQTAPNQGWSGWLSHGSPPGFNIFGP